MIHCFCSDGKIFHLVTIRTRGQLQKRIFQLHHPSGTGTILLGVRLVVHKILTVSFSLGYPAAAQFCTKCFAHFHTSSEIQLAFLVQLFDATKRIVFVSTFGSWLVSFAGIQLERKTIHQSVRYFNIFLHRTSYRRQQVLA